jgi:hypothetical protein
MWAATTICSPDNKETHFETLPLASTPTHVIQAKPVFEISQPQQAALQTPSLPYVLNFQRLKAGLTV